MKKTVQSMLSAVTALLLLLSVLAPGTWGSALAAETAEFTYKGQTGEGTDEFMGDPQDVYWVDASVQYPEDYTKIVGFRLTVNYVKHDNYGGGKENDSFRCGMILATRGAHEPSEYNFTYDNGQTPEFDLSTQTVTSFGVGEAGWLISMVFSKSVSSNEDAQDGDTLVLEYESEEAVFAEGDSVLTLVSFLGQFEYVSIEWILGDPEPLETNDWERVETIEYLDIPTVSDDQQNGFNYVDICVPDTGEESYPVVLWIHGGGYITGDRKSCLLSDTKEYLLSRGYAFVSAEYTLTGTENVDASEETTSVSSDTIYTTAGMPDMLYDLKAAVRFLRANGEQYGLNTDFIAAMGESAGAGLALLLGTSNSMEDYEDLSMGNAEYSSDIQAIVSVCGPSCFCGDFISTMYAYLGSEVDTMSAEELEELAEKWSPTELVNSDSPAMFLTYSRADTTVPFAYAEVMETAALACMEAKNVTTVYYDNGGHVDRNVFDTYSAYTQVADFLDAHRVALLMAGGTSSGNKDDDTSGDTSDDAAEPETPDESGSAVSSETQGETKTEETDSQSGSSVWVVVLVIVIAAAVIGVVIYKKKQTPKKPDGEE